MSLTKSRYESQNLVNNFNLFIDSSKSNIVGDARSRGDDYHLHLGDKAIQCEDGEIIRLSLVNFNMFNNIYNVNETNCKFRLTTNAQSIISAELEIPHKNYKTIGDVALAFANVLKAGFLTQAQTNGSTATQVSLGTVTNGQPANVSPPKNDNMNATGDRLIDITMETQDANGSPVAHTFNPGEVHVQCFGQVSDSYALLGAERIDSSKDGTNVTHNSFKVTVNTNTVRIESFFPGQRMTDPSIYLRCQNTSNGLESIVLSDPTGNPNTLQYDEEVVNSNILAKIHRDSEFITFESSSDEYFINLQNRVLSNLRLFLTDKSGRPLGRPFTSQSGTASGLESNGVIEKDTQSTLGNLFFDCTIKVEIIRVRMPNTLDTPQPSLPQPAREAQSVITWPDYGRPKY